MKTLIKNKIDRLVSQGYKVEDSKIGYKIGEIHAYTDSDFFPAFLVEKTDLEDKESKEIYSYLQSIYKQQFIEYLKGD